MIRWAVVGAAGVVGKHHIRSILDDDKSTLIAICDTNVVKGRELSETLQVDWYADLDSLLTEKGHQLDAVSICTPHYLHYEQVAACIASGKHVLVEKPLAISSEKAFELVQFADRQGVLLSTIQQYRCRPEIMKAKQIMDSGQIGDLYRAHAVHTTFRTEYYFRSAPWRSSKQYAGAGVIMNQAPHMIDLMLWFMGVPKRVTAVSGTVRHNIEVDDIVSVIFDYGNGIQSTIHCNTVQIPGQSYIELFGDKGNLHVERDKLSKSLLNCDINVFIKRDQSHIYAMPEAVTEDIPINKVENQTYHGAIFSDFSKAVTGEGKPIVTAREAYQLVGILEAIIESSQKGVAVELELKI
ncbi:hypothetical protein CI793_15155 [Anoxybacillus ayderensis]|uniref:Gfo/Idh/MocA family protein n=1 Tax=Anoxybacillus sp. ST70 TaxID=2864180 RepID=UPI00109FB3C1|nr:Gfo/Idh/MocA family oxidoreductase [Anoxybacillus sp. ST70]MBW9219738.1 Gfo/Idh/MocA family oxidoreductase [Anoxybacillus sp. ST70]THD14066.1 hypothetical protein CI793_15155 [Anoxybacillus ayderensis]